MLSAPRPAMPTASSAHVSASVLQISARGRSNAIRAVRRNAEASRGITRSRLLVAVTGPATIRTRQAIEHGFGRRLGIRLGRRIGEIEVATGAASAQLPRRERAQSTKSFHL